MRGRLVAQPRDLANPGLGRLVAEVLRGPTASERDERGLLSAFPEGVRLGTVAFHKGKASVRLRSVMPPRRWRDGVYATAQLVYTLAQVDGVESVSVRVNGAPCCLYDMRQRPLTNPLTREDFAAWQGAPPVG
jgi:spore germination protein GerM